MDKVLLTTEGFKKFKAEHKGLVEKRKEVLASLIRAREMGDLSENGAYKGARQELSSIDRRLRQLSQIIKRPSIISNKPNGRVSLGNKVSLLVNGGKVEYQIVGKYEADPSNGKISNESLVGRSLLGRGVGEKFILETDKKYDYEILSLS